MNDAALMFDRSQAERSLAATPEPRSGARQTALGVLEIAAVPDIVYEGISLDLSRLHCRIVAALLEEGEPLNTQRIAEIGWKGRVVAEHTVHSQMALLRSRMLTYGFRIKNMRGRGYVLE